MTDDKRMVRNFDLFANTVTISLMALVAISIG